MKRVSGNLEESRLSIAHGVSCHIVENKLLVFSQEAQTVFELNSTAEHIWRLCEAGMSPSEIARELADSTGISFRIAEADVRIIIHEWESLGLVVAESGRDTCQDRPSENNLTELDLAEFTVPKTTEFVSQFAFRLAGGGFAVRCSSSEQEVYVRALFAHLEARGDSSDAVFDLVRSDGEHIILVDGTPAGACSHVEEVGTLVRRQALLATCRNNDLLIAVHAAVLADDEKCVIFPGPSGVGKTMLAAALIEEGFQYFTDEVAIVEYGTHRVFPFPTSLCLKETVWRPGSRLSEICEVVALPCHDGKLVRYVRPPAGRYAVGPEEARTAQYIIFPRYSPENPTSLSPLSKVEALWHLQEAGYELKGLFDSRTFSDLIRWIDGATCYELQLQSSKSAVSIMRSELT